MLFVRSDAGGREPCAGGVDRRRRRRRWRSACSRPRSGSWRHDRLDAPRPAVAARPHAVPPRRHPRRAEGAARARAARAAELERGPVRAAAGGARRGGGGAPKRARSIPSAPTPTSATAAAAALGVPAECVDPGARRAGADRGAGGDVPRARPHGRRARRSPTASTPTCRLPPARASCEVARAGHRPRPRGGRGPAARSRARDVVWMCDPNNPTGALIEPAPWRAFLDALPADCVVVADEAYMDFADPGGAADRLRDVVDGRPVIVRAVVLEDRSASPGLRLGVRDRRPRRGPPARRRPGAVQREPGRAGRGARGRRPATGSSQRRRAEVAAARDALRAELDRARAREPPVAGQLRAGRARRRRRAGVRGAARAGACSSAPGTEFGLPGFARVTVAPAPLMERVAAMIAEEVERANEYAV